MASRSEVTAKSAIASIQALEPAPGQVVKSGKGEVIFFRLDLADLTTIKASAMEFLSKETRLDVIWHNAGVMIPPDDTPTKQGYHVLVGINAYGQSKAMNVMHAHELAHKHNAQGLVSFSLHPGALTTGLQMNAPGWFNTIFGVLRHPPRFGALTELFAGLAPLRLVRRRC
jgi:NAD(P)-dependent dehydrogenase (short-subunit alcohol dehydrogenase family)